MVDRRVTADETLMMTGEMLTKLQEELGSIVRRRQEISKEVKEQNKKLKSVSGEVALIERNIKVLWDSAEQLSYQYQLLEDQEDKSVEMVNELEATKLEMQGKQNLAKAAENTLIAESMKRTSLNQK